MGNRLDLTGSFPVRAALLTLICQPYDTVEAEFPDPTGSFIKFARFNQSFSQNTDVMNIYLGTTDNVILETTENHSFELRLGRTINNSQGNGRDASIKLHSPDFISAATTVTIKGCEDYIQFSNSAAIKGGKIEVQGNNTASPNIVGDVIITPGHNIADGGSNTYSSLIINQGDLGDVVTGVYELEALRVGPSNVNTSYGAPYRREVAINSVLSQTDMFSLPENQRGIRGATYKSVTTGNALDSAPITLYPFDDLAIKVGWAWKVHIEGIVRSNASECATITGDYIVRRDFGSSVIKNVSLNIVHFDGTGITNTLTASFNLSFDGDGQLQYIVSAVGVEGVGTLSGWTFENTVITTYSTLAA